MCACILPVELTVKSLGDKKSQTQKDADSTHHVEEQRGLDSALTEERLSEASESPCQKCGLNLRSKKPSSEVLSWLTEKTLENTADTAGQSHGLLGAWPETGLPSFSCSLPSPLVYNEWLPAGLWEG
jgi:hypothetical protein